MPTYHLTTISSYSFVLGLHMLMSFDKNDANNLFILTFIFFKFRNIRHQTKVHIVERLTVPRVIAR